MPVHQPEFHHLQKPMEKARGRRDPGKLVMTKRVVLERRQSECAINVCKYEGQVDIYRFNLIIQLSIPNNYS